MPDAAPSMTLFVVRLRLLAFCVSIKEPVWLSRSDGKRPGGLNPYSYSLETRKMYCLEHYHC